MSLTIFERLKFDNWTHLVGPKTEMCFLVSLQFFCAEHLKCTVYNFEVGFTESRPYWEMRVEPSYGPNLPSKVL